MPNFDGMKALPTLLSFLTMIFLSGCLGNDYHTHTTVYDDGSIERQISTQDSDSSFLLNNMFGASEKTGWTAEMLPVVAEQPDSNAIGKPEYNFTFGKRFASAQESNEYTLASEALFKIKSEFKASFRWFYSDITYSDTYVATIRFNHVNPDDFFTTEDYAFMNRTRTAKVPTREDSIYRRTLDEKFETYFERGYFEEVFDILIQALEKNNIGKTWLDTTRKNKDWLFRSLAVRDFNIDYLQTLLADSLKVPVRFDAEDEAKFEGLDEKHFFALFDRFEHSITMPSDIIESTADSIAGPNAFWFKQGNLVKDFTMTAQSRQMNYWAIMITVFLFAAGLSGYYIRKSVLISRE